MIYTEDNLIGVEFTIGGSRYVISKHPSISTWVCISKSGSYLGAKDCWEKSTVKTCLNNNDWVPVFNSIQYEIY